MIKLINKKSIVYYCYIYAMLPKHTMLVSLDMASNVN